MCRIFRVLQKPLCKIGPALVAGVKLTQLREHGLGKGGKQFLRQCDLRVVDLAIGHVRAVEKLKEKDGVSVYNLGTGNGQSVLDMVKAFGKIRLCCANESKNGVYPT